MCSIECVQVRTDNDGEKHAMIEEDPSFSTLESMNNSFDSDGSRLGAHIRILAHPMAQGPFAKELLSPASVVTMEPKYIHSHYIAEFWCSITSPFFALASVTWAFVPNPTFLVNLCCAFSIITAVASTVYHATNIHVLGIFDCSCAVIMAMLAGIQGFSVAYPGTFISTYRNEFGICTVILGFSMFLAFWRLGGRVAIGLFVAAIPFLVLTFIRLHLLLALTIGAIGCTCFVLDRKKVAPLHSIWHVTGGIAVMLAIMVSAMEESNAQ